MNISDSIPNKTNQYSKGKWETIQATFKGAATHVALFPNNKIFAYGGSALDRDKLAAPPPAEILDLDTMLTHTVNMDVVNGDLWCGGHTLLENGHLLFVGGTQEYPAGIRLFEGLKEAYLFDPFKETWTRLEDMNVGRWYPTLIRLTDNTVMTVAGIDHDANLDVKNHEICFPRRNAGHWEMMEGEILFPLYPRLHLLSTGDVFYSGVFNSHFIVSRKASALWSPSGGGWVDKGGPHFQKNREEGISLLLALRPDEEYKNKVLVAGGGSHNFYRVILEFLESIKLGFLLAWLPSNTALRTVEQIDLSETNPRWAKKKPMNRPRIHAVGVLLPDGNVLAVGGMSKHAHRHDTNVAKNAILEPEMYDPEKDEWTLLAPQSKNRVYHSTALLLPDGRVISMGSNPHPKSIETAIEIFSPPYLNKGPRPVITDCPENITYKDKFQVKVENSAQFSKIVLMRPEVLTHVTNTDQRLLELNFEVVDEETLDIEGPLLVGHMPQGYCMLFALSRDGVPSIAKFVRVS